MTAQRRGCWLGNQARHQTPFCIHCFEFRPCLEKTAREVRNVVHIDKGGQMCEGNGTRFVGRAELGQGVSKLIIKLDYNNL